MALITAYNTGTASVANGSKAVTGSGTAWLDIGLTAGDVLWNVDGTASQRIDTVTDNTHMTLVNNWGGTTLSGAAYEIRVTPPSASIAATVRALLELLSNGVLSGLAALTATTGNIIQSVSGAWASVTPATMLKTVLTTAGDWLYNDSGTVVRKTTPQAAALLAAAFTNVGQLPFPSTSIPSTDPNTLDDYEEGTFTPGLAFGGGTTGITYSAQLGIYVKVGKIVFVSIRIVLTSKGSSTGGVFITGLPITSDSTLLQYCTAFGSSMDSSINNIQAYVNSNDTRIGLQAFASGASSNMTNSSFTNTTTLGVTAVYKSAA